MAEQTTRQHVAPELLTRVEFSNRVDAELVPFVSNLHDICFVHIDHLRRFNRINGVERGDEIMDAVSTYLSEVAVYGLVARYAGDGFVVVVPHGLADSIVDHVAALLPKTEEIDQLQVKVGSIECRRPLGSADCIKRARFACDMVADDEEHAYRRFDEDMQVIFDKRAYVVDHLDEAIARGEIRAWSQPIIRVLTGRVCEVEILARWESERFGFIFPNEFIPLLESHGLIHKLDLEVFRLACIQWQEARALGMQVPFGVNLSRLDFELCDIYSNMRAIMERYEVPVDQVHVEVTESTEGHHDSAVIDGLRRFYEAGFRIYMDDFGTGYSSLGTMADQHYDVIKIDKSFVDRIETNERARSVLADTVSMIKRLGMQTLCEGVETESQLSFLRAIGCEKVQGYYISRPVSQEQVKRYFIEHPGEGEPSRDDDYYDAIGQVSLLDGTSAATHGVEAATINGRNPIVVIEYDGKSSEMLTCNIAYERLLTRMGFESHDDWIKYLREDAGSVFARVLQAIRKAAETGLEQQYDLIVGNTYCSVTVKIVAQYEGRLAVLNMATAIDNAPQITEKTLLAGILSNPDRKYFWKDNNRRFLGANQAFLDYYSFPGLETILGKNDEDMGWHVDNDPFRNDELRVLAGETIDGAHGICESKGEYRRIIACKRPLYSNGAIVGLVGYFEDVGPFEGTGTSW